MAVELTDFYCSGIVENARQQLDNLTIQYFFSNDATFPIKSSSYRKTIKP